MRKLTLNADPEVIDQARQLAEHQGTSISALFARIVQFLASRAGHKVAIGRLTRQATGLVNLSRGTDEHQILADALLDKYEL